MKKAIRITAIFLALVLTLAYPVSAATPESAAPYAATYLTSYNAEITVLNGSQFRVDFWVNSDIKLDTIGASTITIFRSLDGTNWHTWKTVSGNTASQKSYYESYVDFEEDCDIYYMAKVTIIGTKNNNTDTRYVYTGTIRL